MLPIHDSIHKKLDYFIEMNKIPHILFNGPSGSGKRTILNQFINKIYNNDKGLIKKYVMTIDCGHGKGIKFIREELKFFSKTNILKLNGKTQFKSIILFNADKLTIDAQSAMRRCIELFSHTTRFFIVVQDTTNILHPILSRFSQLNIPLPIINKKETSLHTYNIKTNMGEQVIRLDYIKKTLADMIQKQNTIESLYLLETAYTFVGKGYHSEHVMNAIESMSLIEDDKKYTLLNTLEKIKREFRNETLFIFMIFSFLTTIRNNMDLENMSFM